MLSSRLPLLVNRCPQRGWKAWWPVSHNYKWCELQFHLPLTVCGLGHHCGFPLPADVPPTHCTVGRSIALLSSCLDRVMRLRSRPRDGLICSIHIFWYRSTLLLGERCFGAGHPVICDPLTCYLYTCCETYPWVCGLGENRTDLQHRGYWFTSTKFGCNRIVGVGKNREYNHRHTPLKYI